MQTQMERGVTLLEWMIVVAIIGILLMLAVPTYQQQIEHSRRGVGLTHLLKLHIQQEAYRLAKPQYATTQQLSLPNSKFYHFSVENVSPVTFTLNATAINSQQADTDCTVLAIDQAMTPPPGLLAMTSQPTPQIIGVKGWRQPRCDNRVAATA